MPSVIKSVVRAAVLFLFPRYPFVNALTFLMLLAERADTEKQPPFSPKVVYLHVFMFFLSAVAMGFSGVRRLAALAHASHMLYFAYAIYSSDTLDYRSWVKIRMAHRMIGVAGYFILFAYFSDSKPRQKWLKRIGEITVGVYILMATYVVLQSPEDKEAFLKFVPGFHGALFLYATLLAAIGLCHLPGQFVYDLTAVFLFIFTLSTSLVDAKLDYWTKRRGLHYWNQIRLLLDNIAIICGAILYLSCSKKKVYYDKDE